MLAHDEPPAARQAAEASPRRRALEPHAEDLRPIKLIGLGGTGGIVARYLVMYLAALAEPVRVVLIDGDEFEPKNAARMFFTRYGNKAAVVCDDLLHVVGDTPLTLTAVEQFVTPDNATRLIREGDIVLLAVDNHATRKLVSRHCSLLADVCLISGGNDGVGKDSHGRLVRGSYGNVQLQLRRGGQNETPSLEAYHPEITNPADQLPGDVSCSEALASVPQILFANLFAASVMLNAFFLHLCRSDDHAEVCFDIADALMRPLPLPRPKRAI